jgi:hypothetical protein
VLKTYPVVTTDQELMAMFAKHTEKKVINMFFSYSDPSKLYEPITKWPEHSQPMHEEGSTPVHEDDYLENPYRENEFGSVDEEVMYLPNHVILCSDQAMEDNGDGDGDEGESEGEDEVEIGEDDELVGSDREADHVPHEEYDKEDPPMTVGSTYPSMEEFKLALSQYAIKHEFEKN